MGKGIVLLDYLGGLEYTFQMIMSLDSTNPW